MEENANNIERDRQEGCMPAADDSVDIALKENCQQVGI
jgi:hypothetical protein